MRKLTAVVVVAAAALRSVRAQGDCKMRFVAQGNNGLACPHRNLWDGSQTGSCTDPAFSGTTQGNCMEMNILLERTNVSAGAFMLDYDTQYSGKLNPTQRLGFILNNSDDSSAASGQIQFVDSSISLVIMAPSDKSTPFADRRVTFTDDEGCKIMSYVQYCETKCEPLLACAPEWPACGSETVSATLLNSNEVSYPDSDQYFDIGTHSRTYYLHSKVDVNVSISTTSNDFEATVNETDLATKLIPANTLVPIEVKVSSTSGDHYEGTLTIAEVECGYTVAVLKLYYCKSTCASASTTLTTTTRTTITAFAPGAQCNCGSTPAPQAPPRPAEEKVWDRTLVIMASVVIVATVASVVVSLRNNKSGGYTTLGGESGGGAIEMDQFRSWFGGMRQK